MTLRLKVPRKLIPLIAPKRFKGAYGGRGGAKSHFFAEQIIVRCLQAPTRVVCIREVQNSIKDSVKQLLTDKIMAYELTDSFEVLNDEIRGRNGSLIVFKGMQSYNATNIKSLEGFDIAWVEEAQTFSQHSLDLLKPTIRKKDSELWFSWNPRYKTDAVDKLFRGKHVHPDSISVQVNWQDNPWFKDSPLYSDMVNDYATDPDKAEHVWGGGYGQGQGAILARWVNTADREGRITDIQPEKNAGELFISSDLGFRDTASWWYWQPTIGGKFRVLAYDADNGLDVDDWLPRIQSNIAILGIPLGKIWLPHDARAKTFQSKRSVQEHFQASFGAGKVWVVPQSKKSDQIEAARSILPNCYFDAKRCEHGLDGLRAWEFEYNEDADIFSREPIHNWASHPSDAFSYGAQMLMEYKLPTHKKDPKFWHEQTLDELWKQTSTKKGNRI